MSIMKKLLFTVFTIGVLNSCSTNNDAQINTDLIGNWKLIEVLVDPGDGSGTFFSIESEKIITFESSGVLSSNGNLCNMSGNTNNRTIGVYSVSESTFSASSCSNTDYKYAFEQEDAILIINYPCIEPCQAKYKKV